MTDPVTVDVDGKPVELTLDELWTELTALGVGGAVRELINRESAQNNRVMERIVTAAGFKRNPGADAMCQYLRQRRTAGLALATLAEGLNGEVVALRRVITIASVALDKPGDGSDARLNAARRALSSVQTVAMQANLDTATERVAEYRRLAGSSMGALGVSS